MTGKGQRGTLYQWAAGKTEALSKTWSGPSFTSKQAPITDDSDMDVLGSLEQCGFWRHSAQ